MEVIIVMMAIGVARNLYPHVCSVDTNTYRLKRGNVEKNWVAAGNLTQVAGLSRHAVL